MNIPFPHEITSCNNTALLPKDLLIQTEYTPLQARTLKHTSSPVGSAHCPSYTYMQIQVDYLYIRWRKAGSAHVLSNIIHSLHGFDRE